MTEQRILIAGGYGVVGQRIAADLGPDYEAIVAGRHLDLAKATAAAIGHGVGSREIDVTVEASIKTALEGIATIVSCIDQPRRGLLHAAIERGLQYTDVTPHLTELGRGAEYEEQGGQSAVNATPSRRFATIARHLHRLGSGNPGPIEMALMESEHTNEHDVAGTARSSRDVARRRRVWQGPWTAWNDGTRRPR